MPCIPTQRFAVLACVVRTLWPLAAGILVLSSAVVAASTAEATARDTSSNDPRPSVHSSDGVRGPRLSSALTGSASLRASRLGTEAEAQTWRVAPGLHYSQTTSVYPQGAVSLHILTAQWNKPGLVLDQVSGVTVASREPLSYLLSADDDIAGVNGDFFDIADTGAPLGVGVDRERRLLHAPRAGWNTTFFIDRLGTPRIGQVTLTGRVVRNNRAALPLGGLNLPHVAPDTVTAYTSEWGRTVDEQVVDGATRVRQVRIRNNVVRSNRSGPTFSSVLVGQTLIGRGQGAAALRTLKVGQRVRVETSLSVPSAQVAVSGSVQLVKRGKVAVTDDGQLHPRTAIGIDRDAGLLHLVVADGRSESSSGLTLLQLADFMRSLGDEAVLNLDGGGSSTLVAPDLDGVVGIRNTPSGGSERAIANGLGFRYTRP